MKEVQLLEFSRHPTRNCFVAHQHVFHVLWTLILLVDTPVYQSQPG